LQELKEETKAQSKPRLGKEKDITLCGGSDLVLLLRLIGPVVLEVPSCL